MKGKALIKLGGGGGGVCGGVCGGSPALAAFSVETGRPSLLGAPSAPGHCFRPL